MEFTDHPTCVSGLLYQLGDQRRRIGKRFVTISSVVNSRWIQTGHETRSAGSTDGTLAICVSKRRSTEHESVDGRCVDERISQRRDRVKSLLIRAVPEDIWSLLSHFVQATRLCRRVAIWRCDESMIASNCIALVEKIQSRIESREPLVPSAGALVSLPARSAGRPNVDSPGRAGEGSLRANLECSRDSRRTRIRYRQYCHRPRPALLPRRPSNW